MSLAAKVFLLVFVMIGLVGFVGVVAFININHAPVDSTIASSQDAYYNTSQVINETMNQTVRIGLAQAEVQSPIPLFVAILVMGSALMLLLLAVKKR